ncbi:MAG: TatD family hydrolase [Clostridia bacterium]|nr:TatD family hydrolase [Clostridia bacterium]
MKLFDSHCHLDDEKFDEDRAEIIARLREGGVEKCVCVGSDLPSSRRCVALAEQYDFIYAAAGVHPHEAKDAPPDYIDQLKALLSHPRVMALGEIGLDYYYDLSPRDVQKRVLQEQLDLACDTDMPVIFHIRDAHGDMFDILRSRSRLPAGVIHCCSASAEMVREYLRMGFYISFAGPITFKNAAGPVSASQAVPLDRLLIETDSPYLAPVPLRGRRNEPANVRYVLEKQAEIHGIPPEELAEITFRNACALYRIPA